MWHYKVAMCHYAELWHAIKMALNYGHYKLAMSNYVIYEISQKL